MNPVLDYAALKAIPTSWVCGECGKEIKKMYLRTKTRWISKWRYEEILNGVCKKCINKK